MIARIFPWLEPVWVDSNGVGFFRRWDGSFDWERAERTVRLGRYA